MRGPFIGLDPDLLRMEGQGHRSRMPQAAERRAARSAINVCSRNPREPQVTTDPSRAEATSNPREPQAMARSRPDVPPRPARLIVVREGLHTTRRSPDDAG